MVIEHTLFHQLNILDRERKQLAMVNTPPELSENGANLHRALPMCFGEDKLINQATLRAHERQRHGGKFAQYNLALIAEVLESSAEMDWTVLMEWFKGHPYGLKVGDKQRALRKEKRAKIDIETELKEEQSQTIVEDWVGPHRYSPECRMLEQTHIADEQGINCQVLVHAVAEYFGSQLPREDRSRELFEKHSYRKIDLEQEKLPIGAVLFFHERPVMQDAASFHLAVCIGYDKAGVPWILHATSQPVKLRPAAEIVPLTYVLANRLRHFYGAVEILRQPAGETASTVELEQTQER